MCCSMSNILLFTLPDDGSGLQQVLNFYNEICHFLDNEEFDAYWDEAAYKLLRGPLTGADRTPAAYTGSNTRVSPI